MAFTEKLPEWQAEGIEPPDSKKQTGWEVEDKPPAGWLNWVWNRTFKVLEELRNKVADKEYVDEAIAGVKVDVPDASLTVKGKVQLSSATDSTSETMAATPKAVKTVSDTVKTFANDTFIKKSVLLPDGTDMNNLMDEGEYYCPANSSVATFKNAPDNQACHVKVYRHAGVNQMWYVFNPNDNRIFTRNYYADLGWGAWRQLIDNTAPWQKRKLTEDNGLAVNINGQNLNNIVTSGFFSGSALINAPQNNQDWFYLEVIAMAPTYVVQNIYELNNGSPTYRQRKLINGTWTAWSDDLFTSVANGKSGIANALSDMGVPTYPYNTFDTMAANIRQIRTGSRVGYTLSGNRADPSTNYYADIISVPEGKIFTFLSDSYESSYVSVYKGSLATSEYYSRAELGIRASNGIFYRLTTVYKDSYAAMGYSYSYISGVEVDNVNKRYRVAVGQNAGFGYWSDLPISGPFTLTFCLNVTTPNGTSGYNIIEASYRMYGVGILM